MAVAEGRHEESAVEVDGLEAPDASVRAGLLAHRAHGAVDHQQRVGVGGTGPDHASGEEGCGHLPGIHQAMVVIAEELQ